MVAEAMYDVGGGAIVELEVSCMHKKGAAQAICGAGSTSAQATLQCRQLYGTSNFTARETLQCRQLYGTGSSTCCEVNTITNHSYFCTGGSMLQKASFKNPNSSTKPMLIINSRNIELQDRT